MSDLPEDLDLKFLPDWLKEAPAVNRYANFQPEPERRGGDRDRGSRSPGRGPGGPPRGRGDQAGPGRRPDGPRPGGPRPGGPRRDDRRDGPPRGDRRDGPGKGGPRPQEREHAPRHEPVKPVAINVEFLPEPNALAAIAKQIRSGSRAYPLFGTARLFLERPERYRVRLTATEPGAQLFQIADGPIAFDRASVERDAFHILKADYYREETVQTDPPKGNFSNVARLRATGALIAPTNHHGYQPALRKIYEERFSRRMAFPEFQQYEIQVLTDEQAINDWKEQARTTTTYVTTQEAEPITFKTEADAEQHFRKTYLPALVKFGATLETSGMAVRASQDHALLARLRTAFESERGFPGSLVNRLRPVFNEVGLHFFKHRKRVIYVSPIRPHRHQAEGPVSEGVATLLKAIEAAPRCKRHDLAVKILGEHADAPEFADRKTALAGDLHYLIHAGHVLEFADATLDLPLPPKALAAEPAGPEAQEEAAATETPAPPLPVAEVAAEPPALPDPTPELPISEEPATEPAPPLESV